MTWLIDFLRHLLLLDEPRAEDELQEMDLGQPALTREQISVLWSTPPAAEEVAQ